LPEPTRQLVVWHPNKSQDPNKERTRHNSENSKIDSKMTLGTRLVDWTTTEVKEPVELLGKKLERRRGIMLVGTLLTKIGQ